MYFFNYSFSKIFNYYLKFYNIIPNLNSITQLTFNYNIWEVKKILSRKISVTLLNTFSLVLKLRFTKNPPQLDRWQNSNAQWCKHDQNALFCIIRNKLFSNTNNYVPYQDYLYAMSNTIDPIQFL